MKVAVTADIHFGVGNNQHIVKNLAKRIIKTNADVLILDTTLKIKDKTVISKA